MTINTQKLRDLIAGVNAATEAHGETEWYAPPGTLYINPDGVGKADFDFISYLSPPRVAEILDHIDAQTAKIAEAESQTDRYRRASERWKKVAESAEERVRDQAAKIERLRAALQAMIEDMEIRARTRGDVEDGVAVLDISDGVLERARDVLAQEGS